MHKIRTLKWLTAWAAAMSILSGEISWGAETLPSGGQPVGVAAIGFIPDVALGPGGVFRGQIVNAQGAASVTGEVILAQGGREAARTGTDQRGAFAFTGLRSGIYDLTTNT